MKVLKKYSWLLFFIGLVAGLILHYGINYQQYYDARGYSLFSKSFGSGWTFNFTFPETMRGYFFPLIINFSNRLFSLNLSIIILNSILITTLAFLIMPQFSRLLYKSEFSWSKSWLFGFLLILFWNGYFLYALSDFPGVISLFCAIVLVLRKNILCMFFAGCLLAIAFNIRPIYQANLLPFMLLIIWYYKDKQINFKMLVAFIVGIIIIVTPQVMINHHYYTSTYSPFTQTTHQLKGNNLYVTQLFWGLKVQKYETYIGDMKKYPVPGVIYKDIKGIQLEHKLPMNPNTISFKMYLSTILNNLSYFTLMSLKHLFNGLDLKYNSAYVTDLDTSILFSLLNYFVITIGVLNIILSCYKSHVLNKPRNELVKGVFLWSNVLIPIVLVIPTAVEVRFFIPIYLILYLYFLEFIYKFNHWATWKRSLALILILSIAIGFAFYLSNTTYSAISNVKSVEEL